MNQKKPWRGWLEEQGWGLTLVGLQTQPAITKTFSFIALFHAMQYISSCQTGEYFHHWTVQADRNGTKLNNQRGKSAVSLFAYI